VLSLAFPYEILILTVHNTIACIFAAGIFESARIVLFTPLTGWNFEDHFEDSKGPGPAGHDAIAGFFWPQNATSSQYTRNKRNLESLYSHSHTNTKMVARNLFCVEGEGGTHAQLPHTSLCG
jgi:hypothetical protein